MLFKSYIDNPKYREQHKNGGTTFNYIPQFVRMDCENGRQYMTNIVLSLAKVHKADVMVRPFSLHSFLLVV